VATGESGTEAQRGSGVSVKQFLGDAESLSAPDFEELHGGGFLLLSAAGLTPPESTYSTRVELDSSAPDPSEMTAGLRLLVFPVRRTERSITHLITVGRMTNNDVVVPDISVSRFHAFVKHGENGGFQIQDGGSTNGTTVNGNGVPPRGAGPPTDLKSGDSVRLGQVEFTFLEAPALRDFLLEFRK
jgi:hypothetical protein